MPYNQLAWEIPAKGWDLLTAINIRAPFRLSSLLLPQMIARGRRGFHRQHLVDGGSEQLLGREGQRRLD